MLGESVCGIDQGELSLSETMVERHLLTGISYSYGFSDASSNAEIGHVVDALWEALQRNGEKGPYLIVAEGYGG